MAARNQAEIVVTAKTEGQAEVERMAHELEGLARSGAEAAPEAQQLADTLRKIGRDQAAVAQFVAIKRASVDLSEALAAAREKASEMGRQLAETEKPTAAMQREFDAARKTLAEMEARSQEAQVQLAGLRKVLADAGISATALATAQRRLNLEQRQALEGARSLAAENARAAQAQRDSAEDVERVVREIARLRAEYERARSETTRLAAAFNQAGTPAAGLAMQFERSARATLQLEQRLRAKAAALQGLTASTQGNVAAQRQLADTQLAVVQSLDRSTVAARELDAALGGSMKKIQAFGQQTGGAAKGVESLAMMLRGTLGPVLAALSAREAFDAMLSMDGLRLKLETVTGSTADAARELGYIQQVSERLGLQTQSTANAWVRFKVATDGTALGGERARQIFESVAGAMSKMGASSEDVSGALLALEQMVSKGVIQSEELKEQLGSRLPGSLKLMAQGLGITERQLLQLVEAGQLTASEALPALEKQLKKTFGDSTEKVTSLGASWQRLKNSLFGGVGEAGNGLLGGALTTAFDVLSDQIKGTTQALKNLGANAKATYSLFAAGRWGDGIKGLGTTFTALGVDAVRSLPPLKALADLLGVKFPASSALVVKGAEAVAESQKGVAEAAAKAETSLTRLKTTLAEAIKAQQDQAAASERSAKARLEEAKAAQSVATANEDEAAARAAKVEVAAAEQALQQTLLANRQADLALAEQQLALMEQDVASKEKVEAADKVGILTQQQKIQALKDEVAALQNATRAAEANADAARRAADATKAAFKTLGITSQQEVKKAAADAEAAFKQIEQAAAQGAASTRDVQTAFIAYAEKVAATGDASKMAALQSQAAVLGVGEEYGRVAKKAVASTDIAVKGLEGIGKKAHDTMRQMRAATERIAGDTSRIADEVAGKQGRVVDVFAQEVQRLAAETSAATGAMARETYAQMMGSARSIGDWWDAISVSQRKAREAYQQQRAALDSTIQAMEQMAGTAQSSEIDIDSLAERFNLLGSADLSRLRSQVERINGEIRRTREEAQAATDQLQQMAETAQDEIDRARGNTAAIEERRLQQELERVRALADKGADAAAVAAAQQRVREAAQARIEAAREADQQARKAAESSDRGQVPVASRSPATQPLRTVRVEIALPGQVPAQVEVADEGSADALLRTLEDLKRRSAR